MTGKGDSGSVWRQISQPRTGMRSPPPPHCGAALWGGTNLDELAQEEVCLWTRHAELPPTRMARARMTASSCTARSSSETRLSASSSRSPQLRILGSSILVCRRRGWWRCALLLSRLRGRSCLLRGIWCWVGVLWRCQL